MEKKNKYYQVTEGTDPDEYTYADENDLKQLKSMFKKSMKQLYSLPDKQETNNE